jgi:excisionase family DNA binding protein
MERLYKVDYVTKILNISISSIYKYAEAGKIKSIKIGSALRFSESNITDYLKKCERNNSGEEKNV